MSPPDSSRAASACFHDAGFPIRIAVAMVSGSSTGCPSTIGAAPAAWKPHISGGASPARAGAESCCVLLVTLPVCGDVAGVADGQAVDVGSVAEGVDDLEGRRLLALDAGRVHRVDELDRVGLGELAGEGQAVVEVAVDLQQRRAVGDRLAQLAHRDLALGHEHAAGHAGLASRTRPPTRWCCRSTRRSPPWRPCPAATEIAVVMPRSLNEPVGLSPSNLS